MASQKGGVEGDSRVSCAWEGRACEGCGMVGWIREQVDAWSVNRWEGQDRDGLPPNWMPIGV